MKQEPYLSINPMGKVPAIKHSGNVVTEVAAICCYLADVFPEAGLAPQDDEQADYYRWMFFASGPVEQAVQQQGRRLAARRRKPADVRLRQLRPGDRHARRRRLTARDYICGDHFTAADLFVGANVNFMLAFNLLEPRDSLRRLCRAA